MSSFHVVVTRVKQLLLRYRVIFTAIKISLNLIILDWHGYMLRYIYRRNATKDCY